MSNVNLHSVSQYKPPYLTISKCLLSTELEWDSISIKTLSASERLMCGRPAYIILWLLLTPCF